MLAQSTTTFDALWVLLVFAFLVALVAAYILMYFVIWSRVDWDASIRVLATVAVSVGLLFPWLAVPIYGIIDVLTRPSVSTGSKIGFSIGLLLLGPIGALVYFIWALRNKPEPPEPVLPPPPERTSSGSKALPNEDLSYLQELSDLHDKGVLTDEQYQEQRRQRLGE